MIAPSRKESARAANSRQVEIEECLAAHGLMPRPRQRVLRDVRLVYDDGLYRRLTAALTDLGSVFASFGIHLSSRADLLRAKNCLELAGIPDKAAASPVNAIKALLDSEFALRPAKGFVAIDEEPFESRLLFQSHRARLFSGEIVTVTVMHPELLEHLDEDLELLSVLSRALPNLPLGDAIEDFRYALKRQTDFVQLAAMMTELSQEAPALEVGRVPLPHREFCTPRVLTCEHLSGSSLATLIGPSSETDSEGLQDIANRLLRMWLQQSLLGSTFPVDPRPENILIVEGRQIVFTGGSFSRLSPDVKANLHEYLVAVVNHNPDKACSCLLKEMKRSKGASDDELRRRIRQVVPFRDGGWSSDGDSAALAEYLFAHWRLAHECGYSAQPLTFSFFQGLAQLMATIDRLTPGGDPLLQGLQDFRMELVFAQLRELMTLDQLSDRFDKYAALMSDFPERLNHVLTLAAEGDTWRKPEETQNTELHTGQNSPALVIGLLFLLSAVALLAHQFSTWTSARTWVDSASAIVFLVIGAVLMRVVCLK